MWKANAMVNIKNKDMLTPTIIENANKGEFLQELGIFLQRKNIVIESVNYSGAIENDEIWYSALIIWREASPDDPYYGKG